MSVNATRHIISALGGSLVVERHKLLEYSRKAERSDVLVRQILHKLRKKNLVYVHRERIINIPLLLLYYHLSCLNLLEEDVAVREVAKVLVSEGVEEGVAVDLVLEIVNTYLSTYRGFVHSVRRYYEETSRLVGALRKEGLSSICGLLQVYLGILVSEGVKLIEAERGRSANALLWDELLGTKLFLESLARFVEDRHNAERLSKIKRRLAKEIEKIRRDEDRHAQRFATLFLEQTIAGAMSKVLPKFYVRVVLYRLKQRRKPRTGQDSRQ